MKTLLLLISLLFIGCSPQPKFKLGDKIIIAYGFYEGCTGIIKGLDTAFFNNHYKVGLSCFTKTGIYNVEGYVPIEELEQYGVKL